MKDIKSFDRVFRVIQYKHVYRSANKVADALAKDSIKKGMGSYPMQSGPGFVQALVDDDWVQEPD